MRGPDFTETRADLRLMRDGSQLAVLHPYKRFYRVEDGAATGVAIRTNLFADVYAVLDIPPPAHGASAPAKGDGSYILRLYYNPLVPWIWLGAACMALGGLISLTDRRHRVGAPVRRVRPVAPPVQAAAE